MNTQEIQEAIARVSDAYGRAVAAEVRARERVVAAGEMVWELTQESGPARFRALVLALSERGLTLKAVEKAGSTSRSRPTGRPCNWRGRLTRRRQETSLRPRRLAGSCTTGSAACNSGSSDPRISAMR
jgi:hypothetical protein